MSTLNYIGVVVQLLGVAVTAFGLFRTYEASGHTQTFPAYVVTPVVETVHAITATVISLVRRILRRPKPTVLSARSATATTTMGAPSVWIGYGTLKEDVSAAFAELHRRTQELMDKVQAVDERLADETDRRKEADDALRRELLEQAERLSSQDQRVAMSGIRAQAVGLALIAVGIVLAVLPL